MQAEYYIVPDKNEFLKYIDSLNLSPEDKEQAQLMHVEKVWIDTANSQCKVEYKTVAPIPENILNVIKTGLLESLGVTKLTFEVTNDSLEEIVEIEEEQEVALPTLEEEDSLRGPMDDSLECASNEYDNGYETNLDYDEEFERAYNTLYGAKKESEFIFGKAFKGEPREIDSITEEENKVVIEGILVKTLKSDDELEEFVVRELRTGRVSLVFNLADATNGIYVKFRFENKEEAYKVANQLKAGMRLRIYGDIRPDKYLFDELAITPKAIRRMPLELREDNAEHKRVELHCHTKMSRMDGVTPIKELIETAERFGHKALAITDHGVIQAFPNCYSALGKSDLKLIFGLEGYLINDADVKILKSKLKSPMKIKSNHIIILAKNEVGLRNLYKLVSLGHLSYLYKKKPMLPRSVIEEYREGLLLGSACEGGELYRAIEANASDEELEKIASFYDYLEIQPIGNNMFLERSGFYTVEELKEHNKKIYELGKKLGKLTVATCDVHFLNPEDSKLRAILQDAQGYSDADQQAPLYFRTTEEMLREFSYLGEKVAYEVVVTNTNKIADMIEKLKPVPDKDQLYSPIIPGAEEKVKTMTYDKAHDLYGRVLPEIVEKRLELELNSIINHGFASLYYIAHKLVKKSLDDGYLVGSRGSVGSSFVATMIDITEVNPLIPHYRCPNCRHTEFFYNGEYGSGFDLPIKECHECNTEMIRDGHDIPFAVFMGFHGDKVPDIDLNFSGEYQPTAHKYTEELFGRDNVCRAGTISTIAPKKARTYVWKYYEKHNKKAHPAFIDSKVEGLNGVKHTTGQHPGGIMVIPRDMDIHYITPMSKPADKNDSDIITTHYDYHSINDRLVKLDILGHDDPTVIKMLEDLIGIDARTIPIGDEKTMAIFSSPKVLGVTEEQINSSTGTYGIPECGTAFTRGMIHELQPKMFSEVVRVSGYSHGTAVWLNNAQELIKNGTAKDQTISTRDDIMTNLIAKGVEPSIAFKTMEYVRKGGAAKQGLLPEMKEAMVEANVPEWYINSCEKIAYLFPKAHAVAYVLMAYRIAYCKVHYPKEYYAAYFTVRAPDFDATYLEQGLSGIKNFIKYVYEQGVKAAPKDKTAVTFLELVVEMMERGFKFAPIDIYESDPVKFKVTEEGLRPPLKALDGIGKNAALAISAVRDKNNPFVSHEDIRGRSKVGQAVIDKLAKHGVLKDLPETAQISLF